MQRWILLPGAPPDLPGDFASAWKNLRGDVVDQNRLRHVERVDLPGWKVFTKFFHRPRPADLFRNLCTRPRCFSQAAREVKIASLLEKAGLHAVPMAAFGEERLGPIERRSMLVTVEVKGPTLGEVLRKDPGLAYRFAPALKNLLEKLLANRIYLPDLSLEHILLPKEGTLVLLDLHNALVLRRWTDLRLARMLGRLWAGAAGTVRPFTALRLAVEILEGLRDRPPRRKVLIEASRRGERWGARERRKRREGGEP